MTYPTGRHCECARCGRTFTGLQAFDTHQRPGRVCLEPSSIGMWLATDGVWGTIPRSAEGEAANLRAVGVANAANLVAGRTPKP